MTRRLVCLISALVVLPAPADAQEVAAPSELAGHIGVRMRSDHGNQVTGVAIEGAIRPATAAGSEVRWEFALGASQMTAHIININPGGSTSKDNVRENSLDVAVRAERTLAAGSHARLTGAIGAVLGLGLGCTGGGSFSADASYGGVTCVNDFAKAGSFQPGADARLALELGGAKGAFTLGALVAAHTAAAGNGVSPAAFAGFRLPMR